MSSSHERKQRMEDKLLRRHEGKSPSRSSSSRDMDQPEADFERIGTFCGFCITILSWCIILVTFPLSMFVCLKIVKEYERLVIFRIGRLVAGGPRGPGMVFYIPCIDSIRKIDLRVVTYAVPPQEILSKVISPFHEHNLVLLTKVTLLLRALTTLTALFCTSLAPE